jgi:hypothetical protein
MTLPPGLRVGDAYRLHLTGILNHGESWDILNYSNEMTFKIDNVFDITLEVAKALICPFEMDITIHVRKASKTVTEFYTFFKFSVFHVNIIQQEPLGTNNPSQYIQSRAATHTKTLQTQEYPTITLNMYVDYKFSNVSDYIQCNSMMLTKL